MKYVLHHGDCLEVMRGMEAGCVDAVVTDPPAGIAFMNKSWDRDKGGRQEWIAWMTDVARECLRVVKPGGHALVWAIPRTSHWTGTAWEDAGWEPREKIYHCFGSGFPKSLDISKALDKPAGAERCSGSRKWSGGQRVGGISHGGAQTGTSNRTIYDTPATEAAKQWDGWGSAIKPAIEEWWLFRKPVEGTIAENVLKHGTGGLNVGACRIEGVPGDGRWGKGVESPNRGPFSTGTLPCVPDSPNQQGRYPSNLILDGSPEVVALFPVTGPAKKSVRDPNGTMGYHGGASGLPGVVGGHNDNGGSTARFFQTCPPDDAKRLFYTSKASKADRDRGCEGMVEQKKKGPMTDSNWSGEKRFDGQSLPVARNHHPTVKPTSLMRYLCRLITPPDGIILDPFLGSGSTGKGAMLEGFRFIGIEQDAEYLEIARARISATGKPKPKTTTIQGRKAVQVAYAI